jgi:threonine dehydrogenase-like Zn-dependent dehydrogenase
MGARVVAMGRNTEILKTLAANNERVETVQITGDMGADLRSLQAFGIIDAYLDISPPEAASSTHFQSCILALKPSGRVSFMGGLSGELNIPIRAIMHRNLTLKGKWMYSRQDVKDLIKMIEIGVLKLDRKAEKFALEDWEKGFDAAAKSSVTGMGAIIVP